MFLYDISAIMLYFILYFFYELVFFYEIFYKDVITLQWRHSFLTDPNKLHSMCKIRNERHFIRENFLIFGIFIEKVTIYYENHVYSAVTLYLSPIPFGPPVRVGSVSDTSFTYLRILFSTQKTKQKVLT